MAANSKTKILLVDDEPANLIALTAVLEPLEATLVSARSGQEALRCLLQDDFAVILLDVHMPAMDGFETAALVRQRDRSQYTPIIFLTAVDKAADDVARGYSAGAVDYILKPFDPEILKSKVNVFVELFVMTQKVKQQEARLIEQKNWVARSQLASIIESSNDAIVVTDIQGKITSWNPAAERIFGYTAKEIEGKPLSMLVHPGQVNEVAAVIARLAKGEQVKPFEMTGSSKTSTRIDLSLSASPVSDAGGNITGASFITRDITDYKRLEQELTEKNAELEQAIRTKDRFLAAISHELRTPLNAIIGFAGILLMKLSGPLTDKQEKQLLSIETSARHLHMLINDLLDLSRIESGKAKLKFEPVNCRLLADEIAGSLRPLADTKGISFQVKAPKDDFIVVTDERSLKQILLNLVSNGIKFTSAGQVNLDINCQRQNGRTIAEFSVMDTGIGIKEEDKLRLFRPFEQVDEGKPAEGTGLGLYLSNKLSRLLGGTIEFESQYEKGSKFTLLLPQTAAGGTDGSAHFDN